MHQNANHQILIIIAMGVAIAVTRLLGYWLTERIKVNETINTWLAYLPGCILVSIVAPLILSSNYVELLAVVLIIFIMWKFNNFVVAMFSGVAFVGLGNWLFIPFP